MKIFIDTADIEEIEKAISSGIVDGITTNPSLISRAAEKKGLGNSPDGMGSYIIEILKTAGKERPVSLEVLGLTADEMIREALVLYEKYNGIAENVVIKIPVNTSLAAPEPATAGEEKHQYDGIRAIAALSKVGIPVNCTLIMTPEQALLAAKAGAHYVSPFAGRIDDYIRLQNKIQFEKSDYFPADGIKNKEGRILEDNGIVSGVDLIRKTADIFNGYKNKDANIERCSIIAASVRNTRQLREIALAGAHIATVPFDVLGRCLEHYKTKEGVAGFLKDAKSIPGYAGLLEK